MKIINRDRDEPKLLGLKYMTKLNISPLID